MDMDLKRNLRHKLLKYAPQYGLDGLVPQSAIAGQGRAGWGFVRSWGWKACMSSIDVGVIIGAILEVGKSGVRSTNNGGIWDRGRSEKKEVVDEDGKEEGEEFVGRFWDAYDALEKYAILLALLAPLLTPILVYSIEALKLALPTAQHLHRAILRTGTSLISKKQIRHLRAFRMAVVKEGPDVLLFTHPAALIKLALWIGEAVAEMEREDKGSVGGGRGTSLVVAGLNERRGVYVVVGTGGGGGWGDWGRRKERGEKRAERAKLKEAKKVEKERMKKEKAAAKEAQGEDDDEEASESDAESISSSDSSDSEDDHQIQKRSHNKNRFGNAFQEVVDETNTRVRIDSFEHCVVEVKKEDLSVFLESLSGKAVIG